MPPFMRPVMPDYIPNLAIRRTVLVLILLLVAPCAFVLATLEGVLEEARYAAVQTRTMWSRDYRGHW